MTGNDGGVPNEVERLRQTLVWLIESQTGEPQVPCSTCGHDIFDHVDEEGTNSEGACYFPKLRQIGHAHLSAPHVLCRCQAFTA